MNDIVSNVAKPIGIIEQRVQALQKRGVVAAALDLAATERLECLQRFVERELRRNDLSHLSVAGDHLTDNVSEILLQGGNVHGHSSERAQMLIGENAHMSSIFTPRCIGIVRLESRV